MLLNYFKNEYFKEPLNTKAKITRHSNYTNQECYLIIRSPLINHHIENKIKEKKIIGIIAQEETLKLYSNHSIELIECKDPSLAWSYLCNKNFPSKPEKIIKITGTNGKTSTTTYISQILTKLNIPNLLINGNGIFINNNLIEPSINSNADAYTLHKKLHDFSQEHPSGFAVIEITSIGIEQKRNAFIKSNIALWTNFTKDHLDYHKTKKNYFNTKLKLEENTDLFLIHKSVNQKKHRKYGLELLNAKYMKNSTFISLKIDNEKYKFSTNLIGEFNTDNILSSIIALKYFFDIKKIIEACRYLKPTPGRLEQYSNVIIDYAHTKDAIKKLFSSVKKLRPKKIHVVIGFAGGRGKERLHEVSKEIYKNTKNITLTTDNPREEDPYQIALMSKKICKTAEIILDREEAIRTTVKKAKKDDIILVLGKSADKYQEFENGRKELYSEKDTVKKILKELNLTEQ